jgi:hypothetical protein
VEGCKQFRRCRVHSCNNIWCLEMNFPGTLFCKYHQPFEELVKVAQNERSYVPPDIWTMVSKYK